MWEYPLKTFSGVALLSEDIDDHDGHDGHEDHGEHCDHGDHGEYCDNVVVMMTMMTKCFLVTKEAQLVIKFIFT